MVTRLDVWEVGLKEPLEEGFKGGGVIGVYLSEEEEGNG